MAKKHKTVHGVRFAAHVDTSGIDWESPADPALLAALKRKPKVRITTMLDADVLEELKRIADDSGGEIGYQTALNALLRAALFPKERPKKKSKPKKAG